MRNLAGDFVAFLGPIRLGRGGMAKRSAAMSVWEGFLVAVVLIASTAFGQEKAAQDEAIDAIRRLESIAALDQGRIKEWVQSQVERLRSGAKADDPKTIRGPELKSFRKVFKDQWKNAANTAAFRTQFATQVGVVAQSELAKSTPDPTVHTALAGVLLDVGQPETISGLLVGLKSPVAGTRLLSARGLENLRTPIGAEKEKFELVLPALREAAGVETSPVVLGRMYEAMAFPNQVLPVSEAVLAVFQKRRESRGASMGAELPAFEWFRNKTVLAALSPEQRADLVRRLAAFLRIDAERYADPGLAPPKDDKASDLAFVQRDAIERSLDAVEDILTTIPIENGGKIRDELNAGGYENRMGVLREAAKWVGDAKANTRGVLNDAPWNVPVGAP